MTHFYFFLRSIIFSVLLRFNIFRCFCLFFFHLSKYSDRRLFNIRVGSEPFCYNSKVYKYLYVFVVVVSFWSRSNFTYSRLLQIKDTPKYVHQKLVVFHPLFFSFFGVIKLTVSLDYPTISIGQTGTLPTECVQNNRFF